MKSLSDFFGGLLCGTSTVGTGYLAYCILKQLRTNEDVPDCVKKRINTTYMYFCSGICLASGFAFVVANRPKMAALAEKRYLRIYLGKYFTKGLIVAVELYRKDNFKEKNFLWILLCCLFGCRVAYLKSYGRLLHLYQSGIFTSVAIGGLSAYAVFSPKFPPSNVEHVTFVRMLYNSRYDLLQVGFLLAAFMGTKKFQKSSTFGKISKWIWLYGNFALSLRSYLSSAQCMIGKAKIHSNEDTRPFDLFENFAYTLTNLSLNLYESVVQILLEK